MIARPSLPPIHPKTPSSPRKINRPPYTYRELRKTAHPAPRVNLFLNPSLNEFDDPIEREKEYKKVKLQILQVKKSIMPLNEELRTLDSYNDHSFDNPKEKELKKQKADLEKEKKELDFELALKRREFNEVFLVNLSAEIDFLKSKFRENEVELYRIEDKLTDQREKHERILNSKTAEDLTNLKELIRELNKELTQVLKEGDELSSEYCSHMNSIASAKFKDEKRISNCEKSLKALEYQRDKKRSILRKMRKDFEDKRNSLLARIELKHQKQQTVQDSQNWRQRLNVQFDLDPKEQKENQNENKKEINTLYVTNSVINDPAKYKIIAPAEPDNDFDEEETNRESDNEEES